MSDWTQEDLCRNLANYYVKGSSSHWLKAIAEVRERGYGLRCKELAELQMMAARYAGALPFKAKLDEMFGPTPPLLSDQHFLAE